MFTTLLEKATINVNSAIKIIKSTIYKDGKKVDSDFHQLDDRYKTYPDKANNSLRYVWGMKNLPNKVFKDALHYTSDNNKLKENLNKWKNIINNFKK